MNDVECNCGSTYDEEVNGEIRTIHFEDCALISERLVVW